MDTVTEPVLRDPVRHALDICPVEIAAAVSGGAWKMTVIKHLTDTTLRFGELQRAIGPVTARSLTRQLRELEADRLIHREVYAQVPPRVEYSLTPLGASLAPIVELLDGWGAEYAAAVCHPSADDETDGATATASTAAPDPVR